MSPVLSFFVVNQWHSVLSYFRVSPGFSKKGDFATHWRKQGIRSLNGFCEGFVGLCRQATIYLECLQVWRSRRRKTEAVDAVTNGSVAAVGWSANSSPREWKRASSTNKAHSDAPEKMARIVFEYDQLLTSAFIIQLYS